MNVAIFKINHLGDNVVFLPVVQALRHLRPEWRLTLISTRAVDELYAADVPTPDYFAATGDLKTAWRRPWELARWLGRLRARHFDASLVSYDQSSVAHGLARVAGGRVRVGGAGLDIRLRGTLTHQIARREDWGVARWNWEMGRALVAALDGGADWPAEPPPPDLSHLTRGANRQPRRVVIHAGSKWEYTRWPRERYVELAARLAREWEVLWINAPETTGPLPPGVVARDCASLSDLVATFATATLFIGNNSGPMHLANAVGTPAVIVCGPSSPVWDPPWRRDTVQLLRTPGLACLPCDRGLIAAARCANANEPLACLSRWPVDTVEQLCRTALTRRTQT